MSIRRRFSSLLPVSAGSMAPAVLGVLAAQTVLVSSAQAQVNAVLVGKVTDRGTGQPLPNVQVVVTSNSLQGEQTVESDSSGLYRIPNLPAGTYTVQFFKGGFKPFTNPSPVVLRAGQTIRFNAPMQAEGAEEIEILIEAPTVDLGSSSSGTSLDENFIKKVPVVSAVSAPTKSFEAVAVATPGAQADRFGTSVAGTTSPENGYKVDGVSVGNPAFGTNGSGVTTEFLSEVQVVSGGYMPEYGRATGGVLSATTRSGSNEFHGAVWLSASPGALEGGREELRTNNSSIQTDKSLHHVGDIGFVVDGPIKKDKLWFAVGAQVSQQRYKVRRRIMARSFDDQGNVIKDMATDMPVRQEVPGGTKELATRAQQAQFFGKLTYGINQDHRISLTALHLPSRNGNATYLRETGPASVPSLNGRIDSLAPISTNAATDVALQWTGSADNKRWTFNTSLALHHETSELGARDGSKLGGGGGLASQPGLRVAQNYDRNLSEFEPDVGALAPCAEQSRTVDGKTKTLFPCEAHLYVAGGVWAQLRERKMNRIQFRHTTGRTLVAAGHHNLKAGVDIEHTTYENRRGYTGTALIDDREGKGMLALRRFGILTGPDQASIVPYFQNRTRQEALGAFIQDSWSIMDKVTLNAGLRYDAIFMYGSDGSLSLSLPSQFAPRVGLIWDPTQKGKSKIFGQFAKYYQGMSLDMADRSGGSINPGPRAAHDRDVCLDLARNPSMDPAACLNSFDPGRYFGGPGGNRYWRATSSAKTPVDPTLKPQSSSEFSLGGEYNVLPSGKVSLVYQRRWLNEIIEDMSRDDGHTYFIANPGRGIAADFPRAQRTYNAVQLSFTKTYKDHWLAQASYQWSRLEGNIDGLFRPETGQLDPNINSDFDLVSLLPNRIGALSADRRHEIKAFLAGDYPVSDRVAITGGLAFNARSGSPTNYLGAHEIYGPGEQFLLVRGSGERLPWQTEINLNLGADLLVGNIGKVSVGIEVFNVANFQKATAFDQNYTRDARLALLPDSTDPAALDSAVDATAQKLADEKNKKNGVTDPNDPKFTTQAELRDQLLNRNFGTPTSFQVPRTFRFSLRYEF